MSRIHRAPCGYLVFDDGQVIRDVNVEGATSLEYEPDELIDKPLGTILSAEVRMFFSAYAFPLLAETGRADEIYVSMRKRSGQDLPVLINMSRWTSADGGLNEGVFLPIRRRHIFERELAQAHEREASAQAATRRAVADAERLASGLELSERLAALGLMAAGIAHRDQQPAQLRHRQPRDCRCRPRAVPLGRARGSALLCRRGAARRRAHRQAGRRAPHVLARRARPAGAGGLARWWT